MVTICPVDGRKAPPVASKATVPLRETRREFIGDVAKGITALFGSSVVLSLFPESVYAEGPFGDINLNDEFEVVPVGKRQRPIIYLWLEGGISHIDSSSPLPDAPREIKGPFNPIKTSVPGVILSETLPKTASLMDKIILVRSLKHGEHNHGPATHLMFSGRSNVLGTSLQNPSFAVKLGNHLSMTTPGYVTFNSNPGNPYLYPGIGEKESLHFKQQNLDSRLLEELNRGNTPYSPPVPKDFDSIRHRERNTLLNQLDRGFPNTPQSRRMDSLRERANSLVDGEIRETFDLSHVPDRLRDLYGKTSFGNAALVATRLIRAGVPFVTICQNGWDQHSNLENELKNKMPELDNIIYRLITDSGALVIIGSEFGRSATMHDGGGTGRSHNAEGGFFAIGGNGITGRVVGRLDNRGKIDGATLPGELAMPTVAKMAGYEYRVKRANIVTDNAIPTWDLG